MTEAGVIGFSSRDFIRPQARANIARLAGYCFIASGCKTAVTIGKSQGAPVPPR
jgi:hypothetical protein